MVLIIMCLTISMIVPVQFNCSVLTVEAHSGRTDKYGGHKDNKNKSGLGSYHYHCGGNPAHLHDNGVCPYAGTTSSSSLSSSNTNTTNTTGNNTASNSNSNTASTNNSKTTSNSNSSNNTQPVLSANNKASSTVKISDTSYDNAAFNASYYANNHADVYKTCGDDAKALYDHFITYGIYEGRQSSAQFSILVYKENNQDLADAFGEDLIKYYNHFIEYGVNENRTAK